MSDLMRPVPFSELLERIVGEYREHESIFGIDKEQFYFDDQSKSVKVFSQECSTPLGPAAGPHTQLAQNIISSYLVGARFIELKTVQIMDHLEIAKPCIDARDEGYNVEWSTEYTLEKAYDEYLKAWIALHLMESCMLDKIVEKPSFIFNMSVGYNLDGIKQEKMQTYIDSMIDAGRKREFKLYIEAARKALDNGLLEGTGLEDRCNNMIATLDKISANISPSVTVSTMHGCPPKEIEAICSYLLTEKKLDTFVKLNPTLLGYDTVRSILDSLGYDYIVLNRASFEHDLQLADAKAMLKRLVELAEKNGRGFGVKLTNTLGNVNDKKVLPGDERYMSGRTLLPISTRVALILSEEFNGKLPISYSGGATSLSIKDIFESGIHPITLATDMLKPGGYTRLKQMVEICNSSKGWEMSHVDISKLRNLTKKAMIPDGIVSKSFRGLNKAKVGDDLSLFDCFVAPCVSACPIHQPIPDYVALAGEGRIAEALALIYTSNALPNITGWICDHQCQNHCTRMDYEGPVKIREIKRLCAENGFDEYKKEIWESVGEPADTKAAVIGAGPAGLAASYFLARSGFETHVFEKEANAGGVVMNTIPAFRIPTKAVERDIEFIKDNGVVFHFSTETTINELKEKGFDYIFIAIGADKSNDSGVSGNGERESAISFLYRSKQGERIDLGKDVVIIGGGNTAMDAARMAKRSMGVDNVTVIYRRSISEMPCDREEYEMALRDGIKFMFLSNPSSFVDGVLTVNEMQLGDVDKSGRRRPVETGKTFNIDCSYLISAIGEKANQDVLKALSFEGENEKIYLVGDVKSGPSTVVRCISSAQRAVENAIDDVYKTMLSSESDDSSCDCNGDCTCNQEPQEDELADEDIDKLKKEEDEYFRLVRGKKSRIRQTISAPDQTFMKNEASRCIECSYLCTKCVEVCPNRANVAIDLRDSGIFEDPFQILHLDAYCNECGNCATFCPHNGGPYLKKFTLFSRDDDFDSSVNSGFIASGSDVKIRLNGKIFDGSISGDGTLEADVPIEVKAMIEEVFSSYSYLLGPVEE